MSRAREAASVLVLVRVAQGLYRSRERLSGAGGLAGRFRAAAAALRQQAEAAEPARPEPAAVRERELSPAEVEALRTDLSTELARMAARERREPPARAA